MKLALLAIIVLLSIFLTLPVASGTQMPSNLSAEETGTFFGEVLSYWLRFLLATFRAISEQEAAAL